MKTTDYAPRPAPFDSYLRGPNLIVIEIGVSAGAHAHALLEYCPIHKLYLVDPWEEANRFTEGYCHGRLLSHGFGSRIEFICKPSLRAAQIIPKHVEFDGIYCDQRHEYEVVRDDLTTWWPRLRTGGVLGYRNYATSIPGVERAVDEFVAKHGIRTKVEAGEILLFK